ncbi:cellulose synthase/poly-beta-1,6-N-acetylglucosamine synthase-like glycosyltransferase/peptidoglycan/xylan/chitin deacetylase (PgdA/CDA1 family) [Actinoplanes octamycinicus]|uniref:Cellulose synthase/poly-beta-1,6-N-acetylglucosamine synthase-like glycosyltransferase/peptidoglycan/xylan/chitin deacetylase (PgdA/CDA1 family) n=1 Tax=Actinoplanes octamycinicus TaxID=135948 RepID=A0A7W7H2M5_9ACTN|nr:bifunctional polysaccharide deacetylase/glycosyltransferase family 2 protein [Actinoplanes octamycinicus]MBB4742767.1 cellulose synthase/poly-beta-1,6-N-acetylglucosamine synthase-like glycosyltransferase/peptidoglycan/xylan/chitin deacetylase (PgdA/CDA1 family) [Actinoplanes octamycinicus]GIE58378.1 bi-functional transferase/deacetylase [Actinoplanes octamycinicus]
MTVYRPPRRPEPPLTGGRTGPLRALALLALVASLATVMLLQAYLTVRFVPDSAPQPERPFDAVPAEIRDGGPVIDLSGAPARTYRLPARTIALTFDDGPDPRWTPLILDVLRRHRAHATFFVLGSQVVDNTGLTRRITAEGHQVGVHSFTHPDMSALPAWLSRLERSATQGAIADATGRATSLYRPPYSSEVDAVDNADLPDLRDSARRGYLTVLNDRDSEDWRRPGVATIVRRATPPGDAGAVVLMHDAGGDRSQTVAALDRLLTDLQPRGYRFTTVSAALTGSIPVADPDAGAGLASRGWALRWAIRATEATMRLLQLLTIIAGSLILARTILLIVVATGHARRRHAPAWSWGPPVTAPVSIIVPAFNEAKTIGPAVRSLALSAHPGVEVIVVDDASTDGTGDVVRQLGLGNVRVVRTPSGGKAAALTTGAGFARHDLIVMVDADTVTEPDAIHRIVQPFADPGVGAVSGNVKVGNRRGLLGAWQHIEYVIGFNLDRRLYDALGCIGTIPGALGAFRRQALTDAGGLHTDTLAEDTDLTIAVQRAGWRVVFEDSARAWTEAPTGLRQLWRQRYRWSFGTMQAWWKHRRAVLDRGPSGRFGRRGLLLIAVFTVVLPLLAPLIDLLALYGFVVLDRRAAAVSWLAVTAVQAVTAVVAFRLDHEPLWPLWSLPLQQVAYRQFLYLVLLHAAVTALTGRGLRWQKLRRTGGVAVPAGAG